MLYLVAALRPFDASAALVIARRVERRVERRAKCWGLGGIAALPPVGRLSGLAGLPPRS